jgi:hypothetical protein
MIQDLDETLKQLLTAELPLRNGEVEIAFDQPTTKWSGRLNGPAVNLFLFDVRENTSLRTLGWEPSGNGNPADNLARRKRPPLRVDCHYILTTWASDPEDEHSLLTRCLLALFRHPTLPQAHLAGSLKDQPWEMPARLAQPDKLPNPAELWSALNNEVRPSISYVVTLALDPWTEVATPLVRSLTLRTGQAERLKASPQLFAGTALESFEIGGAVRAKGSPDRTLAGVDVAVKGTGLFARTDPLGRFRLGSLPPGAYTLVAWPQKGRPVEKQITLPPAGESFDLEL